MKQKVFAMLVIFSMLLTPFTAIAYSTSQAQSYLQSKSQSAWTTMALHALGVGNLSLGHLSGISSNKAIDYTAPILALSAVGASPYNVGGVDYIAKLKSFYTTGQIGDPVLVNDDIFALLAFAASGELASTEALGTKDFLIASQNSDGGWGFTTGSGSDSNMTAVAVAALISAGVSKESAEVKNAFDYLKTAQNSDGGFTYDPTSNFGTDSDSSSTAWVLWAIQSAGQSIGSWAKSGKTPVDFLQSTQAGGGYFEYMPGSGEDAFTTTTTAYAVLALEGKTLPLNISGGSGEQTFGLKIEGSSGVLCSTNVPGPTALDVVKNASQVCGFTYNISDTAYGPYLDKINSDEASGTKGWLYAVNNSLPGVGAAEYRLIPGDRVWWHFGEFDWQPTESTGEVSLKVNVLAKEPPRETVGIVVRPGSLDFASLVSGGKSTKDLTVENIGTVRAKVNSEVTGDKVFVDGLTLDEKAWEEFEKELVAGDEAGVKASLQLPENASVGLHEGKVVFWATAY